MLHLKYCLLIIIRELSVVLKSLMKRQENFEPQRFDVDGASIYAIFFLMHCLQVKTSRRH